MAVRLMSLRATSPRLRPLSRRACFTLPGLISTPRRRPRRRLEATFSCRLGPPGSDACRNASDMAVRLTEFTNHLTRLDRANFAQQQMCPPSAPTEIAVASSVMVANMAAKSSLRIQNSPPLPSGPGFEVPQEVPPTRSTPQPSRARSAASSDPPGPSPSRPTSPRSQAGLQGAGDEPENKQSRQHSARPLPRPQMERWCERRSRRGLTPPDQPYAPAPAGPNPPESQSST